MKKETEQRFTQGEVDLIYWQYCSGLLDYVNFFYSKAKAAPQGPADLAIISFLAGGKFSQIKENFNRFPSFSVSFEHTPDPRQVRILKNPLVGGKLQ
jgi:hypothetical protein